MNADRAKDDESSSDGDDGQTPAALKDFIQNHPIPDEDDEIQIAALHFVQSYVLGEDEEDISEEGIIFALAEEAKIVSDGFLWGFERPSWKFLQAKLLTILTAGNQLLKRPSDLAATPKFYSELYFYKSEGLKDLMAKRRIELMPGAPRTWQV